MLGVAVTVEVSVAGTSVAVSLDVALMVALAAIVKVAVGVGVNVLVEVGVGVAVSMIVGITRVGTIGRPVGGAADDPSHAASTSAIPTILISIIQRRTGKLRFRRFALQKLILVKDGLARYSVRGFDALLTPPFTPLTPRVAVNAIRFVW